MRTTIMAKSSDHADEVECLTRAIDNVTTKIRRRKMPLSGPQQISILSRIMKLIRRLGADARPDVARMTALELNNLAPLIDYQKDGKPA